MTCTSVRAAQMSSICTVACSTHGASTVRDPAANSSFHPTQPPRRTCENLHRIAFTAAATFGQALCGLAKRFLRMDGSKPPIGQSTVICCSPSVRRALSSQQRVCRVWPRQAARASWRSILSKPNFPSTWIWPGERQPPKPCQNYIPYCMVDHEALERARSVSTHNWRARMPATRTAPETPRVGSSDLFGANL